jgi:hypothetical protein
MRTHKVAIKGRGRVYVRDSHGQFAHTAGSKIKAGRVAITRRRVDTATSADSLAADIGSLSAHVMSKPFGKTAKERALLAQKREALAAINPKHPALTQVFKAAPAGTPSPIKSVVAVKSPAVAKAPVAKPTAAPAAKPKESPVKTVTVKKPTPAPPVAVKPVEKPAPKVAVTGAHKPLLMGGVAAGDSVQPSNLSRNQRGEIADAAKAREAKHLKQTRTPEQQKHLDTLTRRETSLRDEVDSLNNELRGLRGRDAATNARVKEIRARGRAISAEMVDTQYQLKYAQHNLAVPTQSAIQKQSATERRTPAQHQARQDIDGDVQTFENHVRKLPYETESLWTSDGRHIVSHVGDEESADWVHAEKYSYVTRGGTLTHNHPVHAMEGGRSTFSTADYESAQTMQLGEMRAVTHTSTFVMKPGPKGWPPPEDRSDMSTSMNYSVSGSIYKRQGEIPAIVAKGKTKQDAYDDIAHEEMTRFAKHNGFTYYREDLNGKRDGHFEKGDA